MPAAPGAAGETAAQPVAPPVTAPVVDASEHPDARQPAAGAQVPASVAPAPAADSTRAAGRVLVTHAPDGAVLEVGRRTRTVPTPLRRALEVRDHHQCQFPGCQLRHCDAHRALGGRRGDAAPEPYLCRYHHRGGARGGVSGGS